MFANFNFKKLKQQFSDTDEDSDNEDLTPQPTNNKKSFIIQSCLLIIKIIHFCGASEGNQLLGIMFLIASVMAIFYRDRFSKFVNIFYFITVTLHYIIAFWLQRDSHTQIINNWYSTLTTPMLVLYFTGGNQVLFFLEAVIQFFLLQYIYSPSMEKVIENLSPKEYISIISRLQSSTLIINVILVWAFQRYLIVAYREALRKKKSQITKQRWLVNSFSHELRNLLQSMIGGIQISLKENLSAKAKDYILNAERCGELLLNLVHNILDTAKAGIDELDIDNVETPMRDTLGRAWSICSQSIRGKNLMGMIKISKKLPPVLLIDHFRLMQILLNLVGNAVKFTRTGCINVTVDWIPHKNKVDDSCFLPEPYKDEEEGSFEKSEQMAESSGAYMISRVENGKIPNWIGDSANETHMGILKINVIDNGCGINADDIRKVFKQFTQVTKDLALKKMGSGLGLYISKVLCERMNGDIRVYSKENVGTTLILCIPAQAKPSPDLVRAELLDLSNELTATKNKRFSMKRVQSDNLIIPSKFMSETHIPSQPCRIMLVDDEHFILKILEEFMKQLNLDVAAKAFDGLEAFEIYVNYIQAKQPLDVIFLDINMPNLNGKEAAMKIRAFEKEQNLWPVRIIMVSANCIESEIAECLDKNGLIRATQFMKKPITIEDLKKAKINRA